jgi:F-type H+-transporting ATPase subunit delta
MTQSAVNYAKVLYELKISEECISNTKMLIENSKELVQALSNPAVKKKEKHAVIDTIFDSEMRNFLKVLCDNHGFSMILHIFDEYKTLLLHSKNILKATITYVTKPDEEQIRKIEEFICKKYNKAGVLLELKEDPSILGGFVLTVGSTEFDTSMEGALTSLYKTLVWR